MKKSLTMMAAVALLALTGACKQQGGDVDSTAQEPTLQVAVDGFEDTVELQLVPWTEGDSAGQALAMAKAASTPVKKTAARTVPKTTTRTATRQTKTSGKAETIYVETEGAQGRVWGHVTMKGDRGTGTIHDWDENTLTVSVTRHGNELFAIDQNSRQYVFRLPN